ncbi:MAG: FAD-dependent oxidoreductase [Candidatus Omnitrophota bacterium]|jgi:flavin-dependent dehydrogenase|nr:MAG: FAD-dependent oxidoreductase [Candidatus Omnitrophota bacterium]
MKRREFMESLLMVGPAIQLIHHAKADETANPAVEDVDILVVGGGFAGCLAAFAAARDGAKTLLVESRTFLGHEMTAALRPWIPANALTNLGHDLRLILFNDEETPTSSGNDEIPLRIGMVKKNLLKTVMDAGVHVLFMSQVVGALHHKNEIAGVVVANKSGLQAIPARIVIDATDNCAVARMSGLTVTTNVLDASAKRVLEFTSVSEKIPRVISAPETFGLIGNQIIIHRGHLDKNHIYAEFQFPLQTQPLDFRRRMEWEIEARQKSILLCEYLKTGVPAFQNAVLLQASAELSIPYLNTIETLSPDTQEVETIKNLFVIPPHFPPVNAIEDNSYSLIDSTTSRIMAAVHSKRREQSSRDENQPLLFTTNKIQIPFDSLHPEKQYDHRFQLNFYSLPPPSPHMFPQFEKCNVLIVGGGTAGASAAIAASQSIENVIVIEPFSGLGGTGTLGGINRYYHGYHGGFTKELDEKVAAMTKRISTPFDLPDWNIEAKMMTYFDAIVNQGGRIHFQTRAIGTIVEDHTVKGVIAATPDGLVVIRSNVTIDATGDGDLAVWAGVQYFVGDPRGGNVQTFNQCDSKINKQLVGVNLDLGVVDITNAIDTARGIAIGHENGSVYDFSPFLSVRESRHIDGEYQFNEADVFTKRRFPDTIAIGKTDYDQHGLQTSLLARMGYIPYHRDEKIVRIPYRVCLPKGVDQLLVIGKAFSATADAFCFMRMQADLQNMGYAIGLAAASAVINKTSCKTINIKDIQTKLIEKGIIQKEDIGEGLEALPLPSQLISRLKQRDEEALLLSLCVPQNEIVPLLEKAFSSDAIENRLYLAMALAWFGSPKGVDIILQELDQLKDQPQSSEIDSSQRPRGGFLGTPSAYWRVNQLIILLGLVKDRRSLDLLCDITANTDAGGPLQANPRLHWRRAPNYDRIISLCFTLERFADAAAIPALTTLQKKPYLNGYVAKKDSENRQNYASAYLELVIATTLARCGGSNGLSTLAEYVEDVRSVLSDHAYNELKQITGWDCGRNTRMWKGRIAAG